MPGLTRAFVGLWPPPAVQAAIARAAVAVLPAGCRIVEPSRFHLTVGFLGDLEPDAATAAAAAVAALPAPSFSCVLDHSGHFARARVAWLAPSQPPAALAAWRMRLLDALAAARIAVDRRPFVPHLTIARACRNAPAALPAPLPAWSVDAAELCHSERGLYRVVARTGPASVR